MNKASIFGLFMGIGAVFLGNIVEGGKVNTLLQPAAALIVLVGTLGATFLSCNISDIKKAVKALKIVFTKEQILSDEYVEIIMRFSYIARRRGFLAIQDEMENIDDPFFKRTINLAIEQTNPKVLKDFLEHENRFFEIEMRKAAKVFETAGGFAPTIGILGAVLGLIHVMENLSDPSKLGAGIAVAFVATIYGVGSANLIFLPISKKILNYLNHELLKRQMLIDGVIGLQAGVNPFLLRDKMNLYIKEYWQ